MSTTDRLSTAEGPGSVSGAPSLPDGFTGIFTSRYVDLGEIRLHAVVGGEGPSGNAAELATYVVEKGKPLVTVVE